MASSDILLTRYTGGILRLTNSTSLSSTYMTLTWNLHAISAFLQACDCPYAQRLCRISWFGRTQPEVREVFAFL